jgi:hypothetical protein
MIWSILSSALKTTSAPPPLSRFFIFMRTVAALRPPRLYSVFSTTIGSLPCMMTLPARISWAIFMAWFPGLRPGTSRCRGPGRQCPRRAAGKDVETARHGRWAQSP